MQLQLVTGKDVKSKTVHIEGDAVQLSLDGKLLGSSTLKPDDGETLNQQFSRIVKDFDEARVCPGVNDERFVNIKFCAAGILSGETWRSTHCSTIFSNEKTCCDECYFLKRALGRLRSKPVPLTVEEKLEKKRFEYRMAQQKAGRKNDKLKVKHDNIFSLLMLSSYLLFYRSWRRRLSTWKMNNESSKLRR